MFLALANDAKKTAGQEARTMKDENMTDSTDYASFRQRLDVELRTRDVRQVRAFLIEEEQWTLDQPTDPEYAMWLMIAGTPTLKDLHTEARQWLVQHGHEEAVDAVFGRNQGGNQGNRSTGKRGANQQKKTGAGPRQARAKGQEPGSAKPPRR